MKADVTRLRRYSNPIPRHSFGSRKGRDFREYVARPMGQRQLTSISRPSVGNEKGTDYREYVDRPMGQRQLKSSTQTRKRVSTPSAKGFLIHKSGNKPPRHVVDFREAGKKEVRHFTHTVYLD